MSSWGRGTSGRAAVEPAGRPDTVSVSCWLPTWPSRLPDPEPRPEPLPGPDRLDAVVMPLGRNQCDRARLGPTADAACRPSPVASVIGVTEPVPKSVT